MQLYSYITIKISFNVIFLKFWLELTTNFGKGLPGAN